MDRVIGIDVSKLRLDVYRLADGRRLAVGNDAGGIAALADQLGLGAPDLVVMEASGGYEWLPHRLLSERGLRVALVNAARVRDFARASGRLAKTRPGRCRGDRALRRLCRPAPTPLLTGARQILAELWPAASSRPRSPRAASSSVISPPWPCASAPWRLRVRAGGGKSPS